MAERKLKPAAYGWLVGLTAALYVVVVGLYLLLTSGQPNPYGSASDARFLGGRLLAAAVGAVAVVVAGMLLTALLQAVGTEWKPRTQAAVGVTAAAVLVVGGVWLATIR